MGIFPKRFLRSNRRKRKSEPFGYSEEELDEQGMRDLEATLSQSSGYILLRGDKLRRYEERMEKLTELFRRTAVLPVDRPVPLESSRRASIQALMQSPTEPYAAGPSRSLDSAHDFVHPSTPDHELSSTSSPKSAIQFEEPDLNSVEHVEAIENVPETVRASPEMAPTPDVDVAPVPLRTGPAEDSPMYTKEPPCKMPELDSEASGGEEIGAGLLDSIQADSAMPDTATTVDTIPLADMNDWHRFRHFTSFSDFNSPLPMKVSSFIDLQTQCVSSSRTEENDRSPQPRTPEKDISTTDGLLFSVGSYEMPLYLHSKSASSATTSSSDVDLDESEIILTQLRDEKRYRGDRTFKSSRVSICPNFPVNVWDDVPPTRLHVHPINV